jgi:hypothetical protein
VKKLHSSHIQNKDKKKRPFNLPQGKTSSLYEIDGDPKKNEKSLETLLKLKLSKLILYLEFGTKIRGDS